MPQIEVTFDIDANGIVNVSAKDLGTGKEQKITITAGSNLSEDEIDKAVKEAEQFAEADRKRKEAIDAKNEADSLIFQTEKAIEELGDKLDGADKSTVEAELTKLKDTVKDLAPETMTDTDTENVKAATESLKQEFYKLSEKLYQQAQAAQGEAAQEVRRVLVYVMTATLQLLHPFMPFITEEIWQTLPHTGPSIMVSPWPVWQDSLNFTQEEKEMERIMAAIRSIRNRRAEMNVPPSKKARVMIATPYTQTFHAGEEFIKRLAYASEVETGAAFELSDAVCIITEDAKIYIPMGELVDYQAEKQRLEKELAKAEKELTFVQNKLSNAGFLEIQASIVQTEPLPFVPAIWTNCSRFCGLPKRDKSSRMRSSPG